MNPENTFREVVFTQNHGNSMMTAVTAKVDAAAVSSSTVQRFVEAARIDASELVVLWESDPIPNSVWYVRKELPAGLKRGIQQALLDMDEKDPELIAFYRERSRDPEMAFVAVDDARFDGLRQIARSLDSMTLLN